MTYSLSLTDAAHRDADAVRSWYLQVSPRVAQDFEDELDAFFARIVESPKSYPVFHNGHKRAVMQHFKYLVFFHIEGDKVVVSLIVHQKRNPFYWQERLG